MRKYIFLTGLLLATATIVACSSEPKVAEFDETTNPQTELDRLDNGIADARDHQVNVLSPENFMNAVKSRQDAIDYRASGKKQKKILHKIAVADAYLDKATTTADVSRLIMQGPSEARQDAIVAKAPQYYGKKMQDADEQFVEVTSQIEKNGTSKALSKRDKLESIYRQLEIDSIKNSYLTTARNNMSEALKEGAKKLTPDTLNWAKNKVGEDQSIIEAHRHDGNLIDTASADATAASERLLKMVREAKASTEIKPEEIAKKIESKENEAKEAESDRSATAHKLANSQLELNQTEAQNSNLESKVWLDKEFEKANSQFSKNEAEVYKQGDKLLLRLKGLTFPKNQAVITSQNFALLAKVQDVLRDVAPSQVEVEGHTDSSGGKKINDELSKKRAEAVQSYLVSNNNVPDDKIVAKGYGYTKPIATNKTAEGRAQNRRVDIVITPQIGQSPSDQMPNEPTPNEEKKGSEL
jgi:OmpA-OmpF porin, OOP family